MAFKGQLYGKLKIASVSTGKYVMPFLLSDFMSANPAIELVLDVNNRQKVLESLEIMHLILHSFQYCPRS